MPWLSVWDCLKQWVHTNPTLKQLADITHTSPGPTKQGCLRLLLFQIIPYSILITIKTALAHVWVLVTTVPIHPGKTMKTIEDWVHFYRPPNQLHGHSVGEQALTKFVIELNKQTADGVLLNCILCAMFTQRSKAYSDDGNSHHSQSPDTRAVHWTVANVILKRLQADTGP